MLWRHTEEATLRLFMKQNHFSAPRGKRDAAAVSLTVMDDAEELET